MLDPITKLLEKLLGKRGLFVIIQDDAIRLLKIQAGTIRDQNFFIELTKMSSRQQEGEALSSQDKRHIGLILTEYIGIEKLILRIQHQNRNLIIMKPITLGFSSLILLITALQLTDSYKKVSHLFPSWVTGNSAIQSGYIYLGLIIFALMSVILVATFKTVGNLAKHKVLSLMMDYSSTITTEESKKEIEERIFTIESSGTDVTDKTNALDPDPA